MHCIYGFIFRLSKIGAFRIGTKELRYTKSEVTPVLKEVCSGKEAKQKEMLRYKKVNGYLLIRRVQGAPLVLILFKIGFEVFFKAV